MQIRELEADGVVKRKAENTVPEKVEYSLTKLGEMLSPIISSMGNRISESFKNRPERHERDMADYET